MKHYHILNELHDGIVAMRWTIRTVSWTNRADDPTPENNYRYGYTIGSVETMWETVRTTCETWFNDPTIEPTTSGFVENNGLPWAQSVLVSSTLGGPEKDGGLHRRHSYAQSTGMPTCMNSALTIWAKAGTSLGSTVATTDDAFDANGDGMALNEWREVYSGAATNTSTRKSTKIGKSGTTDYPTWVSEPPIGSSYKSGYLVIDAKAIAKWDVAGGLEYV